MPFIRVIDLETAGFAQTDVCEIGWQDVELGSGGRWFVGETRGARFVNPGRAISIETMAIHHILDAHVSGAPFWPDVAAEVLRPPGELLALAAHRAAFEQRYCTPRLTGSAKWICTWKSALRQWPHLEGFSNQKLRYQRMPSGLVHDMGLPAHRALPDAYVTAFHLRDLLNETSAETLITWSKEPGLLPRVRFGPERGRSWMSLDDESLQRFLNDRDPDVRFSAQTERRRRGCISTTTKDSPAQPKLL